MKHSKSESIKKAPPKKKTYKPTPVRKENGVGLKAETDRTRSVFGIFSPLSNDEKLKAASNIRANKKRANAGGGNIPKGKKRSKTSGNN